MGLDKKKRYSTDANLAGLSHEAEDLESIETPCTIVEPAMGTWPQNAPDSIETFTVTFNKGNPSTINGEDVTPYRAMKMANEIAGEKWDWYKKCPGK